MWGKCIRFNVFNLISGKMCGKLKLSTEIYGGSLIKDSIIADVGIVCYYAIHKSKVKIYISPTHRDFIFILPCQLPI